MKNLGPLLTLAAGGVLAVGIGGLSARAVSQNSAGKSDHNASRAASTPTAIAPSASAPGAQSTGQGSQGATTQAAPVKAAKHDYAGYTRGGAATLAIAVRGDKAIAYLCDGKVIESWLRGSATGGRFELSGKHGAHLTGSDSEGKITGSVRAGGVEFGFTVSTVKRPAGLYRLTAEVRGARLDGGWIVLPDGRQIGLLDTNGTPGSAPSIDLASNSVNVGGQNVPAQEATP
jgi:hypothetical protein